MLKTNPKAFYITTLTILILAWSASACQPTINKPVTPTEMVAVVVIPASPAVTVEPQPILPTATTPANTPAPTSTSTPTRIPLALQATGYEGTLLRSVCLEVRQSYTGMEGGFTLPVEENLRHILASQGIQVMPAGGACEATLSLELSGEPLSATYSASGQSTDPSSGDAHLCYAGASIQGEMAFSPTQGEPLLVDASFTLELPYGISDCAELPTQAPFDQVLPVAVYQGLGRLWGGRFLTRAWESENMPTHISWKAGAREALVRLGNEMTPVLLKEIQDTDKEVRLEAARVFYHADGVNFSVPISELVGLLDSPDWQVRQGAVESLGWAGSKSIAVLPELIALMQDNEAAVRSSTAWALARVSSDAQIVEALHKALDDPDESVRAAAVLAFGDLSESPEPLGKADLLQALQNESAVLRQAAARGLYHYASDLEVMAALMAAIKDSDPQVRAAAVATLGRTTPTNFAAIQDRLKLALADGEDEVASSAAYATGMMGMMAIQMMPDIQRLMHDQRVMVRSAAIWAFARIAYEVNGAEALAVPEIVRLLDDPQSEVRLAACGALVSLATKITATDKATLTALIQALEDDQEQVQHAAAAALVLISGQAYTQDAETWQNWLARQL